MPSFDIVSEVDKHELTNSVDAASRIVNNRFDFKGVDANFDRQDYQIILQAEVEFQLTQMIDILQSALHKNGIDITCLEFSDVKGAGKQVKQEVLVKTGIESLLAKKIVKHIKDKKLKVQAQIQGEQVRVTGKKRDDLQAVMASIKTADFGVPFQYTNFRD